MQPITSGHIIKVNSLEEIAGQSGFVFAPYDKDKEIPILFVPYSEELSNPINDFENRQITFEHSIRNEISNTYKHDFLLFHKALEEKKFEKLVLARQQVIKTEGIQTSSIFEHACRMYPRMMVYEFTIPKGPTWVGCTPELLISGKDGVYRTTALAGTLPLPPIQNNDSEEYPLDIWDSKNLSEQKIVEHYIEQILRTYAADIIKSKPYTARAGQLLHIRTDFEFTLKEGMQITEVIKALHPTPAVCGLPKKEALAFIDNCETGNREYYAGFLGKWNVDGETELYVNLRCARTEPEEQLRLFVGSGLLESSTCDSEWNETEHKMRTIIDTL